MKYIVEVVEFDTDCVVREIECGESYRSAEKCANGIDINLDHEKYFTRIESEE
jgi:hypothetical protein